MRYSDANADNFHFQSGFHVHLQLCAHERKMLFTQFEKKSNFDILRSYFVLFSHRSADLTAAGRLSIDVQSKPVREYFIAGWEQNGFLRLGRSSAGSQERER